MIRTLGINQSASSDDPLYLIHDGVDNTAVTNGWYDGMYTLPITDFNYNSSGYLKAVFDNWEGQFTLLTHNTEMHNTVPKNYAYACVVISAENNSFKYLRLDSQDFNSVSTLPSGDQLLFADYTNPQQVHFYIGALNWSAAPSLYIRDLYLTNTDPLS